MKNAFATVIVLLLILNTRAAALPDKVRVLSLDLQNARIETPGTPGSELSQELRHVLEMADVDIICVQGATDWENCERLGALKPGLQVVTCSAFTNTPQVAVLARATAVLSWVDEGEAGSGFALAIFQCANRKVGVFAAQNGKTQASSAKSITDTLLGEVKKLKKFPQNRPDSFIIAGAGLTKTTALIDNQFQEVASEPHADNSPEFFAMNAGFLTRPRTITLKTLKTPLTISDFDTSSSFSSKFAYQTPLLFPGETLASLQAASQPHAPPKSNKLVFYGIGGAAFLLVMMMFFRRSRPATMQMVPVSAGSVGPNGMLPAEDPVRSNLIAWLKSAFLQRLISHRQELLNNEAEATRRTMVIEEKLSNLQSALQARISAYETRIERLEQELTAATLDNRELIRAQIELLKEKVAKAKQEHALGRN